MHFSSPAIIISFQLTVMLMLGSIIYTTYRQQDPSMVLYLIALVCVCCLFVATLLQNDALTYSFLLSGLAALATTSYFLENYMQVFLFLAFLVIAMGAHNEQYWRYEKAAEEVGAPEADYSH